MPQRKLQPAPVGWLARHSIRYLAGAGFADQTRTLLSRIGSESIAPCNGRAFRMPLRDQAALLNLAAELLRDPSAGFHLALQFDPREWGPLYYMLGSAGTLRKAIAREVQMASPLEEGFRAALRGEDALGLAFQFAGVERRLERQLTDFTVTAHLRMFRKFTERELVPRRVTFIHGSEGDVSEMQRYFGVEIGFGAEEDRLVFNPEDADLPCVDHDPFLETLMMELHDGSSASSDEPFRLTVEKALTARLGHGTVLLDDIAASLGVNRRKLARRLADEGERFSNILDRVRYDLAMRYLRQTRLPISQIGWLLGYGEASTFVRAVRRWTDSSPAALRRTAVGHETGDKASETKD